MGECLWADKPSRYVTRHLGQLSLPNRVLACVARVKVRHVHLCRVAGNTVQSHMAALKWASIKSYNTTFNL